MAKKHKKIFKSLTKKTPAKKKYNKMYLYFIIVNYEFSDAVIKLLKDCGSNVQTASLGRGTAKKEVLNIMGFENNSKGIIMALADQSNIKTIENDLSKYFVKETKVMGIGFTIPLTSIVGEKLYCFLTNTL